MCLEGGRRIAAWKKPTAALPRNPNAAIYLKPWAVEKKVAGTPAADRFFQLLFFAG